MNLAGTETVRFTRVVEAAGKPEVISLWARPERDKNFMTAVRQGRVMSIKQETVGSAKDFGIAGFIRERNVSYLVFPGSLRKFEGRRIVGIKYDLIGTPGPMGRVIKPETAPKVRRQRKTAEWRFKREPTIQQARTKPGKEFTVTIRFSAMADVLERVEASSKKEAKQLALRQAVTPDLRGGTVTRRVVKIAARS